MLNSQNYRNYVGTHNVLSGQALSMVQHSSSVAMNQVEDNSLYRVDFSMDTHINAGILNQSYYGLGEYWSLMTSTIPKANIGLENAPGTRHVFSFKNFDQRFILTSLASVKYYTANNDTKTFVPYGFEKIVETEINKEKYTVFKNRYALPFGYSYDTAIEIGIL